MYVLTLQIFSEKSANSDDGMRATNFITLAGGMLQAVLYGYGGFRLLPHQLDLKPTLLPDGLAWDIDSLTYRGARISLGVQEGGWMSVVLIDRGPEPMIMYTWRECERIVLDSPGSELVFDWDKVTLVLESEEDSADLCNGY